MLQVYYKPISCQFQGETGYDWNQYKIGTDKHCIYTGACRSALDRFSYPVPNGFICENGPAWNCAFPEWYRDRANPVQFSQAEEEWIESNWNHVPPFSCDRTYRENIKYPWNYFFQGSGVVNNTIRMSASKSFYAMNFPNLPRMPSLGRMSEIFLSFYYELKSHGISRFYTEDELNTRRA